MPYSKQKWTPEEIRAKRLEVTNRWDAKHPDNVKTRRKRYYDKAPQTRYQEVRACFLRRKAQSPEEIKAYSRAYARKRRQEMVNAYGGCCACCGETELLFLTLDHVNGDGAAHRRSYFRPEAVKRHPRGIDGMAQGRIIAELRKNGWPQDGRFRILCWNCQWGTRYKEGCPHQAKTISAA